MSQWEGQIRPVSGVPSHDLIEKELNQREAEDAAAIALRKPFLDQLRWQLRSPS